MCQLSSDGNTKRAIVRFEVVYRQSNPHHVQLDHFFTNALILTIVFSVISIYRHAGSMLHLERHAPTSVANSLRINCTGEIFIAIHSGDAITFFQRRADDILLRLHIHRQSKSCHYFLCVQSTQSGLVYPFLMSGSRSKASIPRSLCRGEYRN
jgi:hypothetical protein